jgi:hypothetical protein
VQARIIAHQPLPSNSSSHTQCRGIQQRRRALLASMVLRLTFGDLAHLGATLPGAGFSAPQAFVIEAILSLGLISTILGTASSARNIGPLSALPVAAFALTSRGPEHTGIAHR